MVTTKVLLRFDQATIHDEKFTCSFYQSSSNCGCQMVRRLL